MLCIVGVLGMRAQTWTASNLEAGKYVFKNVGSGRYLGPGNSWGTQASLIECSHFNTLAKVSDGVYTIESQVSNGGTSYYFNGSYMDNTAINVNIQEDGSGNFIMFAEEGQYYGYDGTSTVLTTLTDDSSDNAHWKILPYDEVYADASENNPVDVTYMILCSNFDRNHRSAGAWTMAASNQNLSGGDDANRCAESWRASFTLSQNVTVPNGYYKLRCQAALTEYEVTGKDFPVVYLNDATKPFKSMAEGENSMATMSGKFTEGKYWTDWTDVVTVTGKSLTLGVKGTRTDTWCIWDNFQLMYLGPIDLTEYANGLAEAVAKAQATEGTIPTAAYNAINAVVEENNKTYDNGEDYSTAIQAINNAVATYASAEIVAAYSNYKFVKSAVLNINNNIDISEAENLANDGTDANLDDAIASLRSALKSYLSSSDVSGLDLTDAFLINPSFETGNFTGWTNSGMAIQGNDSFGKDGTYYAECWQPNGTKSVSQKITGMPSGVYKITASAKARGVTSAKLYMNANSKSITIADSQADYEVEFACDANTDLSIGFEGTGTGASSSWICVDNFKLTLVGSGLPDVTAVEGIMNADVANAQTEAINTYNTERTVANYNAANAAVSAAQASIAAYASAKTAIDKANAIKVAHNFASETAITTFAEAIKDISDKYNDRSLTDAEATAAGSTLGTAVSGWRGNADCAASNYLEDGFGLTNFNTSLYVNTWSTEGDSDGSEFSVPFYEYWVDNANSLGANTWTGTLTGLNNGLYKVSAWVRVRAKDGATVADATGVTMDVNGGTAVDVTEGSQIGETQFQIATYEAEGLVKDGTLKLNFNVAADNNISWLSFQHVKYEFVRDLTPEEEFVAATEEDYAALNAAIESHVLGFDAGEYAPYNNVDALYTLAAAKAIDQEANNSQADVQAATAALTEATWTANTTEVNAVYDGSFEADYSAQSGNINPIGWQRVKGAAADGYNVRLMNGTNAGLAATTSGKAIFTKQSAYYGYAEGYTMPLKANTYYKVTFIYGGWGDCKKDGYVSMAGPDGSAVELSASDLPLQEVAADTKTSAWYTYEAIFTTGEAGDYVLGLRKKNYDTSGQSQYVYGDIVLVRATADDIKAQLLAEIGTANDIDTETNVGDAAFQIPTSVATALTSEITSAQSVYDNESATVEDVLGAIEALKAAEEAYINVELNAPAEGQLFNIILTYSGWTYDNKAMTYIANDRQDQGNYNIKYIAEANKNLAQAFTFTKVEGNNYRISQIDVDGNVRYMTDGKTGYDSGDGSGIRTTTDIEKSAAFKIIATATDGVYNIYNNVKGGLIGSQDAGVYTVNSHNDFKLVETTKPSITINTTAAGYGTVMLPFAVTEIPSGVKVYSCAALEGQLLTLTEVTAMEANKPYIIEGTWNETLTGDAQGTALTYTEGLLTGVYATTAAPVGSYVLQKLNDKVAFYVVEEGKQPKVGANRAYLTAPAGSNVKAIFFDDTATGINGINAGGDFENAVIYNLSGQRVSNPSKGIYIVNGKKVLVK